MAESPLQESEIRARLRALMDARLLQRVAPKRIATRPAAGDHLCVACTVPITKGETEYEIQGPAVLLPSSLLGAMGSGSAVRRGVGPADLMIGPSSLQPVAVESVCLVTAHLARRRGRDYRTPSRVYCFSAKMPTTPIK
jgi:hypothetical protein